MTDPASPVATPAGRVPVGTWRCAAVGLVAGFMSGLFGVGGGILIVPALVVLLGFGQRLAHGTSLAAVLPISIASLIGYVVHGNVDWTVGALLAAGAVAGAVVGTHFLHRLPHDTLAIGFAMLLLATAARMILDHSDAAGRSPLSVVGGVALVGFGFVTGVLAGLLGVGGGIVMVPLMVIGFGMPSVLAKGTSLAVIVPTAVMGTVRNRSNRNSDLRVATVVGLSGIVSAFAGGLVSDVMSESLSKVLFSLLLTVVALRMVFQLVRDHRRAPAPVGN
jgi:uncharacterized membrane protein YfcA